MVLPVLGIGQNVLLKTKGSFGSALSEVSGLEYSSPNHLWAHADGGNPAKLYQIDTTASITRTITLLGATNVDWEDITRDAQGNIYLGDFGNNSNNRQDLKIYKIPDPEALSADSVVPEVIHFQYDNQFAFPPPAAEQNFDMEAMVAAGDSLYLFSKNRTSPWNGWTRMYRLPQDSGTYVAELLDSFYTGPGPQVSDWVTGADLSPDGQHLVLLSHGKIWLFSCFTGHNFFKGKSQTLNLSSYSQKESIVLADNSTLYLADESFPPFPGPNLYQASLTNWVAPAWSGLGPDTSTTADSVYLTAGNNFQSYLWNTGATTPSIWVDSTDWYSVLITSADSCSQLLDSIFVEVSVLGRDELDLAGLKIYPNPVRAGDDFVVEGLEEEILQVKFTDLAGREWKLVQENSIAGRTAFGRFSLDHNIAPGHYFLNILLKSGAEITLRMLVEKP